MMRHPPRSPLFPNTPLSRSVVRGQAGGGGGGGPPAVHDPADGERLRLLRELLPGEEGVSEVTVAGREERVRGDDARERALLFGGQPEPDETTPVLAEQREPRQPELFHDRSYPVDVALVRVVGAFRGLVRASEPDEVGDHRSEAGAGDDRDHLPVEEAPGRLAVQEQHRVGTRWALVDVVHAQRAPLAVVDLDVMRREWIIGERVEALVGCAQCFHHASRSEARSMRPTVSRAASADRSCWTRRVSHVDAFAITSSSIARCSRPISSRRPSSGAKTSSISARESVRASDSTSASAGENGSWRTAARRTCADASWIRSRCRTKVSRRLSSGPSPGIDSTRSRTRSKWLCAAAVNRSSRSSKWTYTDRSETPARSATCRAVGRKFPSSSSDSRASTTASRVRAARAERPSVRLVADTIVHDIVLSLGVQ